MDDDLSIVTMTRALSKKLGEKIIFCSFNTTQLHGGTLGDVQLVKGTAETADAAGIPYKIVRKKQKKWIRPGDPESWRREYDLAVSNFGRVFPDNFRWPECYSAEISKDETEMYIEYIDGVSGSGLTAEMLENAAEELGSFQGRLYAQSGVLDGIGCLGDTGFMERENDQWHMQEYSYEFLCSDQCRIPEHVKNLIKENPWDNGKSVEYNYLRSDDCNIPEHLKQMLIDIDGNREEIFRNIRNLPVVLCHRDFWTENIFWSESKITLIDWDCAGFGYVGEDLASLIADDTETDMLDEYFRRFIPAYFKGFSQFADIPVTESRIIWEMIIIKFGYRIVQTHMFTDSDDDRTESINRLQKIYELRDI